MNARSLLALGRAGCLAVAFLSVAQARIHPRVAMFASVAKAAEFDPLAADNLRASERAFLRQAAERARAEMRAAQLAVAQSTSADVRTFAQQLVGDSRQIAASIEGLARKKGVALLPPTEEVAENYGKLTELAATEFDKEFIRVMAGMQEETIKVYERALNDTKDTDVKELAGGFLPTARDHLNKVRDLKKSFE